jgi:CxxC motif-containing protein
MEIFAVMEIVNKTICPLPVKIGDVLVENITGGVNLVATTNME